MQYEVAGHTTVLEFSHPSKTIFGSYCEGRQAGEKQYGDLFLHSESRESVTSNIESIVGDRELV
jgi:hypothetical protein